MKGDNLAEGCWVYAEAIESCTSLAFMVESYEDLTAPRLQARCVTRFRLRTPKDEKTGETRLAMDPVPILPNAFGIVNDESECLLDPSRYVLAPLKDQDIIEAILKEWIPERQTEAEKLARKEAAKPKGPQILIPPAALKEKVARQLTSMARNGRR